MTANTTTTKGIYLGQGIAPFPKLHAFATNADGSNKSFVHTLEGVVEIDASKLEQKMQAETQAKESFFSTFPKFTQD
jgi:hypothetical protein